MDYACIDVIGLFVLFIINREVIKRGREADSSQASSRYRQFLFVTMLYYIFDLGWGLLYEFHEIPALFPVLYSDAVFYFIFMFMTMLMWVRYIVAYLNRKGRRSRALLYAVWAMFTSGMLCLMLNRFYPFIFIFNDKHEYVPQSGRYIAFLLQIALYMVTSSYLLYISSKAGGRDRIRYRAVGLTCLVMELCLVLQILSPAYPFYAMGLLIGMCLVHVYVEEDEKKDQEVFTHIATSLAEDYEAMYYIDIETGEYKEFSTSEEYQSMNVTALGKDFYTETQLNADKYAHPDDRDFARSLYAKETMLHNLEGRKSYSYKYRIMIGGEPRYFRFTVLKADDGRHLVLYEKDIDDEITEEKMRRESQKKQITFSRIAESLAANYDAIYYVDVKDSSYVSYETNHLYGLLEIQQSGDDFFREVSENIPQLIHKNDRETVKEFLERDHMITGLETHKQYDLDYRLMINGRARYCRMSVRKTTDGAHLIVGVENIDAEVRREKQTLKALNSEKELARRDELTGTKNKTAYMELEQSVQSNIDNGMDYLPFAILVCDTNNLKTINDTQGHVAGDEYLKLSAKLLCDIYSHSPVFRIGGDEFVVFLRGSDYVSREELLDKLRSQVHDNLAAGSGPILASGMAEYIPDTDSLVSEIFDRADREMYENKQSLKS